MIRRFPLLWLALYRRRRMLVSLIVGIAIFETLIVVITGNIPPDQFFGGVLDAKSTPQAFKAFSGSTGDVVLASYAGLLGAGLVHPFWIAMQLTAIGSFGAAIVAADVEAGTLELLVIRPLSRLRLLLERVGALVIALLLLNVAATATILVGVATSTPIHDAVSYRGVLVAGVLGFALALCLSGPVIAMSAAGRHRSQVLATAVAFGAVGYALNFIAIAWSPAASLRYVSPFHYYSPADALVGGGAVPWTSLVVLSSVGLLGTAIGAWWLQRRDLTH